MDAKEVYIKPWNEDIEVKSRRFNATDPDEPKELFDLFQEKTVQLDFEEVSAILCICIININFIGVKYFHFTIAFLFLTAQTVFSIKNQKKMLICM